MNVLLTRALRASDSPGLLKELNQFIARDADRRAKETETRVQVVEQGHMEWPFTPKMSDYCGEQEENGVYYLHEVRNAERDCASFDAQKPKDWPHLCELCQHNVSGAAWERDKAERRKSYSFDSAKRARSMRALRGDLLGKGSGRWADGGTGQRSEGHPVSDALAPKKLCRFCAHHRMPVEIRLFEDHEGGAHPDEVEGRLLWSAAQRRQFERECMEVEDRGVLAWKPRSLEWCARFSLDAADAKKYTQKLQAGDSRSSTS
jgi:hypothetical protein